MRSAWFSVGPFLALLIANTVIAAPAKEHWVGTWATASLAVANDQHEFQSDTTLREWVHVSRGGTTLRVGLTNEFGLEVLRVGGAHIALAAEDRSTLPGTDIELRFGGQKAVAIPPGAVVFSDTVKLAMPPLSNLAITLFIPAGKVSILTRHTPAQQLNFQASGNQLLASKLNIASSSDAWTFLKDVEVLAPTSAGAIVVLGDSITDGLRSSVGANVRWTDVLARRLHIRSAGSPSRMAY